MALADPNTRISLGASSPKKDAVISGIFDVPADDSDTISIFLDDTGGTRLDLTNIQRIVGTVMVLLKYAKTNLHNLQPTGLAGTYTYLVAQPGSGEAGVRLNDTLQDGDITLDIGAQVYEGAKSHFLDRTVKRLIERFLEEQKDAVDPGGGI